MRRLWLWVFLTCLLGLQPAGANMSAPWRAGDTVGEPSADLKDLVVDSERLVLDLRSLGQLKERRERPLVVAEATYQISCPKSRPVSLVFVAPGQTGKAEVWLDDKPVALTQEQAAPPGAPEAPAPPEWLVPKLTPRPGGGEDLHYESQRPKRVLRFTLDLGEGRHAVRVRYQLEPTAVCSRSPLVFWQLAYILAPAKQWAAFGSLEAEVLAPPGWSVATSLPMVVSGESLKGSWKGIPADSLAVSLQSPVPEVEYLLPASALVAVGLCPFIGGAMGGFFKRRGWRAWWGAPLNLGLGGAMAGLFVWVLWLLIDWRIPVGQMSWNWSYGQAMSTAIAAILVAAAGGVAGQIGLVVAHRRLPGPA